MRRKADNGQRLKEIRGIWNPEAKQRKGFKDYPQCQMPQRGHVQGGTEK